MCVLFCLFFALKKEQRRVSWTEDTPVLVPCVPVSEEQSGPGFYFYKHRLWRQELAAPKQPLRVRSAHAPRC